MNKLTFFTFFIVGALSFSFCKKDSKNDVDPQNNTTSQKICTECTATIGGTTTAPAQYCGSESEVKIYENNYISQNQSVGATAKCTRK